MPLPTAVRRYKSSVSRCIMKNAPSDRIRSRRRIGEVDFGRDLTPWIGMNGCQLREGKGRRRERERLKFSYVRWPDKIVCLYRGSPARDSPIVPRSHRRLRFSTLFPRPLPPGAPYRANNDLSGQIGRSDSKPSKTWLIALLSRGCIRLANPPVVI